MNESDAQLIDKHLPETQRRWLVSVDHAIASGGCRIETLESLVDYTVQHRLESFIEKMREQGNVSEDQVMPVEELERPAEPEVSAVEPREPNASDVPESPLSKFRKNKVSDDDDLSEFLPDDDDV